jgi:hypothetical protein
VSNLVAERRPEQQTSEPSFGQGLGIILPRQKSAIDIGFQPLIGGCIMASWASFAWGFFAGLLVGEVTAVFFLALGRRRRVEVIEGRPLAAGSEKPARRDSFPVEAT